MATDQQALRKRANKLVIFTAAAVFVGGILGWQLPGWLPEDAEAKKQALMVIKFPGDLLMQMLKMLVVPLIVATMVVGIASLGDIRKAGRIGSRTILYYAITTGVAVTIGIILVNVIQPGFAGVEAATVTAADLPQSLKEPKGALESMLQVIKGMFPQNLVGAAADMNVLGLIVFSIVLGGVLSTMGKAGKPVLDFFTSFNQAIMKIVHLVVWYAPIGIASLLMYR
ncbi:MAG: dicarboxylate/amino acid:cation symporter, partial [Planctomycetes bacterium]|nr:dicarboxylate/amino acid:cation symporter [Planctomycetota bacterium]